MNNTTKPTIEELIEWLNHFQKNQEMEGDRYGAEVLQESAQALESQAKLLEEARGVMKLCLDEMKENIEIEGRLSSFISAIEIAQAFLKKLDGE